MKRIVYVDPMSFNNLSIYDKNLLTNISNFEIIYFCNVKMEYKNLKNITLKKVFKYSNKRYIFKILSYVNSVNKVLWYILINKPNIVHFQWFKLPKFDLLVLKVIKLLSKSKIVFTAHNVLPHDSDLKFYKTYQKIYNILDHVITHVNSTKMDLISLFHMHENKIIIIPHGLLELNTKIYSKKEIQNNQVVYSFLGNVSHYKGIDVLINAWNQSNLLRDNDNCRLIIAGKGLADFSKINNLNNVQIVNRFITDQEFQEFICQSSVILLPYRKISQSGLLLTVLSYHKPVLVSDLDGLTEPFQQGNIGWIVNSDSIDSLMKGLEDIYNHKEDLISITNDENLWTKIDNYYSWESIGKKTQKLYESLMD